MIGLNRRAQGTVSSELKAKLDFLSSRPLSHSSIVHELVKQHSRYPHLVLTAYKISGHPSSSRRQKSVDVFINIRILTSLQLWVWGTQFYTSRFTSKLHYIADLSVNDLVWIYVRKCPMINTVSRVNSKQKWIKRESWSQKRWKKLDGIEIANVFSSRQFLTRY